jgi:hypothetical protein
LRPYKYEIDVLTTHLWCSVTVVLIKGCHYSEMSLTKLCDCLSVCAKKQWHIYLSSNLIFWVWMLVIFIDICKKCSNLTLTLF